MNTLTLVKRTQKINSTEAALGISEDASWHAKYKDSAYVFVGGIPYELTEGDLPAVFVQYGEAVNVNLVRGKGTGKSKCFAFLAYEDQRSTILARSANTGWGPKDVDSRWDHDRHDGPPKSHKNFLHDPSDKTLPGKIKENESNYRSSEAALQD